MLSQAARVMKIAHTHRTWEDVQAEFVSIVTTDENHALDYALEGVAYGLITGMYDWPVEQFLPPQVEPMPDPEDEDYLWGGAWGMSY